MKWVQVASLSTMGLITSQWSFDVTISILLVLAFCVYSYLSRNFHYWKNRGVKEVKPIILFGNAAPCLFLKKSLVKFLSDIYNYGEGEKMVGFYAFDRPYLLLRDPELIKNVFIKDFNNFSNKIMTDFNTDEFGRTNLFLASNPPWKHVRQKLTPIFTTGKLKNMFTFMLEICEDFNYHLNGLNINGIF